ncbi:MAG: flagellar biosynthesis protein FlhA [Planctomycetes bacterium]|nr:flagellar biosynthesis protein FlhA [Planctomycetota bacterium]
MAEAVAKTLAARKGNAWVAFLNRNTDVVMPALVFLNIVLIILPLSPFWMDLLLYFNMTFSFVLMVTVLYLESPLQLSVFPTLLLMATFFRLALNISTTRLILTRGYLAGHVQANGQVPNLPEVAGNVIATFGNYVGGGNTIVGIVVFVIIMIMQFVVITKGATRIAEVAARFTLDAMPGKQMAIDADLNAGMIDEKTARERRDVIQREAEFFGAMDGASKFVRGDAVAGLFITIVNIVGGLIIGAFGLGGGKPMSLMGAFQTYTLLTIGDGLVSALPGLVTSLAAAFLVTRTRSDRDVGADIFTQVFANWRSAMISGVMLAVLMLTPFAGVPLVLVVVALAGVTWLLYIRSKKTERETKAKEAEKGMAAAGAGKGPERVESLLTVDPMELEIGYGLIRMVDTSQGGDLLERITMIRRQIALDLGFVVPPVRIRDNMQLEPNEYSVKIRGTVVAKGTAMVEHFLAMDSGIATGTVDGIPTTEPAFGLPAVWITEANKQRAEALGYTVVDATSVVSTHLTEVIKNHAAELLTREDLESLLTNLKQQSPKIVEELIPNIMKPQEAQRILQALLKERVSIRNLGAIFETLAEYAPRTKDAEVLVEYTRNSLARQICESLKSGDGKIYLITIDPQLEDLINANIERTEGGSYLKTAPSILNQIMDAIAREMEKLVTGGHAPVILCAPQIRSQVKKIADGIQAGIAVLSYNEVVRDVPIESVGMAALPQPQAAAPAAR